MIGQKRWISLCRESFRLLVLFLVQNLSACVARSLLECCCCSVCFAVAVAYEITVTCLLGKSIFASLYTKMNVRVSATTNSTGQTCVSTDMCSVSNDIKKCFQVQKCIGNHGIDREDLLNCCVH